MSWDRMDWPHRAPEMSRRSGHGMMPPPPPFHPPLGFPKPSGEELKTRLSQAGEAQGGREEEEGMHQRERQPEGALVGTRERERGGHRASMLPPPPIPKGISDSRPYYHIWTHNPRFYSLTRQDLCQEVSPTLACHPQEDGPRRRQAASRKSVKPACLVLPQPHLVCRESFSLGRGRHCDSPSPPAPRSRSTTNSGRWRSSSINAWRS